jgi:hypothetical protein
VGRAGRKIRYYRLTVNSNSMEKTSKTFVPITSKNLASGLFSQNSPPLYFPFRDQQQRLLAMMSTVWNLLQNVFCQTDRRFH